MIAHIRKEYATQCDSRWLSRLCCKIIENGHYISCDASTQEYLFDIVNREGSALEKELIHKSKPFDFSKEEQTYMTTISLETFDPEQCEALFGERAMLLLENSVYEWRVYTHIIDTYKHDRKHPNLIKKLSNAIDNGRLTYYHGGGWSQHQQHIEQHEEHTYKSVGKYKICALLDSDCLKEKDIPKDKYKLYCFLCGEEHDNSKEYDLDKIYKLNQPNYIWHMWYKRSIENYFPNEAYEYLGLNTDSITDITAERDYLNIEECLRGYQKHKLPLLTCAMSRKKYEDNLKHFNVNGEDLSEIQLFLLKLVRII